MRRLVVLILCWMSWKNVFASLGPSDTYDLERRLDRLEDRQFSDGVNTDRKLLLLESKMGSSFFEQIEKGEQKLEKELESQLATLSSKYDDLSQKWSNIEKQLKIKDLDLPRNSYSPYVETPSSPYVEIPPYTESMKSAGSYEMYQFEPKQQNQNYIENNEKLNWQDAIAALSIKHDDLSKKFSNIEKLLENQNLDLPIPSSSYVEIPVPKEPSKNAVSFDFYQSELEREMGFITIGEKQYYIEKHEKLNWQDAVAKCRTLSKEVVTRKVLDRQDGIMNHIDWTKNYWVREVDYRSDFVSHYYQQPNNYAASVNRENCAELQGESLSYNFIDCSNLNYFICYSDLYR